MTEGKHEGLGVSSRQIWSMGLVRLDLKMTKKNKKLNIAEEEVSGVCSVWFKSTVERLSI